MTLSLGTAALAAAGMALLAGLTGLVLGLVLRWSQWTRRWWIEGPLVGGAAIGLGGGLGVLGAVLLGGAIRLDPETLASDPWVVATLLATFIGNLGALVAVRVSGRASAPMLPTVRWFVLGCAAVIATLGFSVGWALLLDACGYAPDAQSIAAALHNPEAWIRVGVVAFVVLGAPVTEELLFRGWMQPLVSRAFGPRVGVVLQAMAFAVLHVDRLWAIPPLFFIGLVGGWLRYKSGSVLPGIVMHILNNSAALLSL